MDLKNCQFSVKIAKFRLKVLSFHFKNCHKWCQNSQLFVKKLIFSLWSIFGLYIVNIRFINSIFGDNFCWQFSLKIVFWDIKKLPIFAESNLPQVDNFWLKHQLLEKFSFRKLPIFRFKNAHFCLKLVKIVSNIGYIYKLVKIDNFVKLSIFCLNIVNVWSQNRQFSVWYINCQFFATNCQF